MQSTREEVYECILEEREYQAYKWGGDPADVGRFVGFISDFAGRARNTDASSKDIERKAVHQIRKIAALGFACMEANGAVPRGSQWTGGPLSFDQVIPFVSAERDYQEQSVKNRSSYTTHFLNTIRVYSHYADEAWVLKGDNAALDVIRKITGVAVRALETLGVETRSSEEAEKAARTKIDKIEEQPNFPNLIGENIQTSGYAQVVIKENVDSKTFAVLPKEEARKEPAGS